MGEGYEQTVELFQPIKQRKRPEGPASSQLGAAPSICNDEECALQGQKQYSLDGLCRLLPLQGAW